MARDDVRVDFKGPFFQGDPRKKLDANIRDLMEALASEAETDVKVQMAPGQPARAPISAGVQPARVSAHVVGRVESVSGKDWRRTAKVSVRNRGLSRKQGVALMAAASRVESATHAFRRTAGRIRRARAVIRANLAKGLD